MGADISPIGTYNHWSPLADYTSPELAKLSDELPLPNGKVILAPSEVYKAQGDYITITEKIDGSNASFSYDKTVDCGVRSYSRNQVLNENLTLNGFYEWVIKNISPKKESLNKNYSFHINSSFLKP